MVLYSWTYLRPLIRSITQLLIQLNCSNRPDLSGRLQCTSYGPELSDVLPVTHGVPQGSTLRPLFVPYLYT